MRWGELAGVVVLFPLMSILILGMQIIFDPTVCDGIEDETRLSDCQAYVTGTKTWSWFLMVMPVVFSIRTIIPAIQDPKIGFDYCSCGHKVNSHHPRCYRLCLCKMPKPGNDPNKGFIPIV